MKNIFVGLLSLCFLVLMGLGYQNCGNISVAPLVPEPLVLASQMLPSGKFCTASGPTYGSQVKFAFIIDMSISNLGNASPRCVDGQDDEGNCPWTLGMFLTPAQDPLRNIDVTTDASGNRFDAIDGDGVAGRPRGFLLECGSQPDFQYSVLGFSTDVMFGNIADSCMSPFKTAQEVKANVTALRQVQVADIGKNRTYQHNSVSPFQMGETFYSKAISCLQKKIESDAANTADQSLYQVFFLTDGRPTDFLLDPCSGLGASARAQCEALNSAYYACNALPTLPEKNSCKSSFFIESVYKPSLVSLKQYTQSVSGNLKLTPIYYGKETGEAKANALRALESMADAVSPDPATNVREISDFNTLTRELCAAYQPQAHVNYSQKYTWAVNLTSVYLNGKHEADSDMDGIADKDDLNPQNPRSSGGVLDKLCRLKNGNTPCVKPTPTCDQTAVGWGLNACDVIVANSLYGKDLTGYDTDNDGLPDFLEIRFGLNPTVSDLGTADLDGDGESNFREIMEGLNPDESYQPVLGKDRLKWTSAKVAQAGCAGGSNYEFTFTQLPLSENLAFSGTINGLDTSVVAGENLVALISIQEPIGRPNLKKKMTVQWIRSSRLLAPVVGPVNVIGDF